MEALVLAAAATDDTSHADEAFRKLSFTRVRIDPDAGERSDAVTRYSRTHLPLPPHTDSAYLARPQALVAFQMVRADPAGGRSTIVPVADVVAALDRPLRERLRASLVSFGKRDLPILWGPRDRESMRYYRAQIDLGASLAPGHSNDLIEALDRIDAILDNLATAREFFLADGEVLFVNNHKALHGRTGFMSDSQRLMYRYRAHSDALE